jgi:hypothetical protein
MDRKIKRVLTGREHGMVQGSGLPGLLGIGILRT